MDTVKHHSVSCYGRTPSLCNSRASTQVGWVRLVYTYVTTSEHTNPSVHIGCPVSTLSIQCVHWETCPVSTLGKNMFLSDVQCRHWVPAPVTRQQQPAGAAAAACGVLCRFFHRRWKTGGCCCAASMHISGSVIAHHSGATQLAPNISTTTHPISQRSIA